ncbi:hypothetical protein C0J52_15380 [Blattella germanica]|nr:hypothetical protein C0J52_15380 [Blattella germanica]
MGAPAQLNEAPSYRRNRDQTSLGTTNTPSPIISRVSRVMKTDPIDSLQHKPLPPSAPPAPFRLYPHQKMPDGEVVVRVYQEQRAPQAVTVAAPGDPEILDKNRRRKKRPPHKSLSSLTQIPRFLAIHYDGDASKYQDGHQHYAGTISIRYLPFII